MYFLIINVCRERERERHTHYKIILILEKTVNNGWRHVMPCKCQSDTFKVSLSKKNTLLSIDNAAIYIFSVSF